MKRKTIMIIGSILLIILIVFALTIKKIRNPNAEKVVEFIKNNPDKSAILLYKNDSLMVSLNPNKVMPLASTVKIIIAIEYAYQAAENKIDPDELIDLNEIQHFYVDKSDGGAHKMWLPTVATKIQSNKISIREIAKGMIAFSSNANTEWLLDRLGLDNVNNRIQALELKHHSNLHYIVSALFVGQELFGESPDKEQKLKALSMTDYVSAINTIHQKMKVDSNYRKRKRDSKIELQKIWSDRLPAASVSDYVSIMQKINSRKYFDTITHQYLDEIMEYLLKYPKNRENFIHTGVKGGSTAFILTKALYATDTKSNKTELAYFFNNLNIFESRNLLPSLNKFDLNTLLNQEFVEKMKNELTINKKQ